MTNKEQQRTTQSVTRSHIFAADKNESQLPERT
jgi:hypothetical protein